MPYSLSSRFYSVISLLWALGNLWGIGLDNTTHTIPTRLRTAVVCITQRLTSSSTPHEH